VRAVQAEPARAEIFFLPAAGPAPRTNLGKDRPEMRLHRPPSDQRPGRASSEGRLKLHFAPPAAGPAPRMSLERGSHGTESAPLADGPAAPDEPRGRIARSATNGQMVECGRASSVQSRTEQKHLVHHTFGFGLETKMRAPSFMLVAALFLPCLSAQQRDTRHDCKLSTRCKPSAE